MKNKLTAFIKDKCFGSKYKDTFLRNFQYKSNIKLLDVGCGNNSPYEIKSMLPNIEYTGIDIGDYNQSKPNLADNYIITTPENFSNEIGRFDKYFDIVISSHNLEHCNNQKATLVSMIKSLKPGGSIYLAFPCASSVNFPSREGTLNYYDDPTHKDKPPCYEEIINILNNDCYVIFMSERYRPLYSYIRGLVNEYRSNKNKKIYSGTWAYYGFETIIWAKKI